MIKTPTYHVFDMYKVHMDATNLPIAIDAGTVTHGEVTLPKVHASASVNAEGVVHVSLCNLDPNGPADVTVGLRGVKAARIEGTVLSADTMQAHNTFDQPDNVSPKTFSDFKLADGTLTVTLPAMSVVVLAIQ